jgi:3-deoxy-7-phosphoheptulonate synthase
MPHNGSQWTPGSWRSVTALQQPVYEDSGQLADVRRSLSALPPLVTAWEVDRLSEQLRRVAAGDAFLLQAGDCSESFSDCESGAILRKLKVLIQMSFVLICGARQRVVRVGRIAGQYAKPRSSPLETVGGVALPSYRGDIINGSEFSASARFADPARMLLAYERSAITLNYLRALSEGGFADLHHPENWDLEFFRNTPGSRRYQELLERFSETVRVLDVVAPGNSVELSRVDFFTSHEALLLEYEAGLTRGDRASGWYNLGTHFPWIGDRTRQLDGAHVEYFRGIRNPIGVKVGASLSGAELVELVGVLNPENVSGRLVLIHRFGAEKIGDALPELIRAVRDANQSVIWVCDPMHGNTRGTSLGVKTRAFDDIVSEIFSAFRIHREAGSRLSGIHLELTGDDVTECTGGPGDLSEQDLGRDYRSTVDPRLNYEQSMEIAFLLSERLRDQDVSDRSRA